MQIFNISCKTGLCKSLAGFSCFRPIKAKSAHFFTIQFFSQNQVMNLFYLFYSFCFRNLEFQRPCITDCAMLFYQARRREPSKRVLVYLIKSRGLVSVTSIPGAAVHGPLIRTTKDATLTYCAVAIVVPILEFWLLLHSVKI